MMMCVSVFMCVDVALMVVSVGCGAGFGLNVCGRGGINLLATLRCWAACVLRVENSLSF